MWKDAPALFKYVERCQAFLTAGSPDSDFLLYLPIYDAWSRDIGSAYMMFDIHRMDLTLPEAKASMNAIIAAGYDADYVSDALLQEVTADRPIIVPACKYMPLETARRLLDLHKAGAKVFFIDRLPEDVPGLGCKLKARRRAFRKIARRLPEAVSLETALAACAPESFRTEWGGSLLRRRN